MNSSLHVVISTSLDELVVDGKNGMVFDTCDQLANQLLVRVRDIHAKKKH
jgi:hypothetical protein